MVSRWMPSGRKVISSICATGPLAKKLCPLPGTAAMSGLLVMRNEVRVVSINDHHTHELCCVYFRLCSY